MATDQERIDFGMQCIETAKEMINRTGDQEAQEYWDHLLDCGYIGRVQILDGERWNKAELKVLDPQRFQFSKRPMTAIIPLYEEDKELRRDWSEFYDWLMEAASSVYQRVNNTIFIRVPSHDSPFIKGNVLLHEAGHARLAFLNGMIGLPDNAEVSAEELIEEGRMHAMNARLWRLWGGSEYQVILEKAFYRIGKISNGRKGFAGFIPDERWSDVFDKLFGQVSDERSKRKRSDLFVLYANLEMIERKGWQPVDHMRASFIMTKYKRLGRL